MFYYLRLIVELLAPLNLILVFLIVAFFCLICNRKKIALTCLVLAISIVVFCGYGFFVLDYINKQESIFPPLSNERLAEVKNKNIKYIVILGSGHVSDPRLPVTSQIGGSSLYRLVEGIRIHRTLPGTILVISGGIGYDPVPNAKVVGNVASAIGVLPEDVIVVPEPRDTMQEAEALYPIIGEREFVLVTSALHMSRATKIFENRGMLPIPAPTDYIIKNHIVKPADSVFPSTANLELTRRITYEWIGKQWLKAKKIIENYR